MQRALTASTSFRSWLCQPFAAFLQADQSPSEELRVIQVYKNATGKAMTRWLNVRFAGETQYIAFVVAPTRTHAPPTTTLSYGPPPGSVNKPNW